LARHGSSTNRALVARYSPQLVDGSCALVDPDSLDLPLRLN
jgi:hypothetical protein